MKTTPRPPLHIHAPLSGTPSHQDKIQVTKWQIRGKLTTRLTQSSFWTQQSTESVTNSKQTMTNTHQNLHFITLFTIDQKHLRWALECSQEHLCCQSTSSWECTQEHLCWAQSQSTNHQTKATLQLTTLLGSAIKYTFPPSPQKATKVLKWFCVLLALKTGTASTSFDDEHGDLSNPVGPHEKLCYAGKKWREDSEAEKRCSQINMEGTND